MKYKKESLLYAVQNPDVPVQVLCRHIDGYIKDQSALIPACFENKPQRYAVITVYGIFRNDILTVHRWNLETEPVCLFHSGVHNYERMIDNTEYIKRFEKRCNILKSIREFFWEHNFLETETPVMNRYPSMEPYLDSFETELEINSKKARMYFSTSPEYNMKKLLVGGLERIFQITKSFRNNETSVHHNPEFTMLEWYRSGVDYTVIMQDTEELINRLVKKFCGSEILEYQNYKIDCSLPWDRITVEEAMQTYAGMELYDCLDETAMADFTAAKGFTPLERWDDNFFQIFLNCVEPNIGINRPAIIYEYPAKLSSLARNKPDGFRSERFEVYMGGLELANAFSELTDMHEQRSRFEEEQNERKKLNKPVYPIDESFLQALSYGMPPAGGIALGVDRLVMLLLNLDSIEKELFFPVIQMYGADE